jgi:Ca2+-binding EF-hand superfamily protein
MYKYLTVLGFSTALILSAQAFAHPNHDDDGINIDFYKVGSFSDVDTNGDGKISENEYLSYEQDGRKYDKDWRQQHWAEMMEKFDENGDNQLEVREIENYAEQRVAEVMEKFHGHHGKWLGEFDFDFDDHEFTLKLDEHLGEVDKRVAEAMERFHEKGGFMGNFEFELDGLGELHEFAFAAPHGFMFHSPEGLGLKDLDSDENGAISREEFIRGRQELFDRLDENGDGVLDEDELKNFSWIGNFAFSWHNSEEDEE